MTDGGQSGEEAVEDLEDKQKTPTASEPWCSNCELHTDCRPKLFSLSGGGDGRRPTSFKCAECKETMWRPADCGGAGWMCLLGVVMVIWFVLNSLDHLVYEPLEIWQIMAHAT